MSNLGNPKMAVFFTGLLPQFAPAEGSALATMLGARRRVRRAHAALAHAVRVRGRAGARRPARPRVRRALDAVMGTALVALGIRLAAEQR